VSGAGMQNGVPDSHYFTGEFSGSNAGLSIGAPTNVSPDWTLMKSNLSVAPLARGPFQRRPRYDQCVLMTTVIDPPGSPEP
jgi:hypothetical protein